MTGSRLDVSGLSETVDVAELVTRAVRRDAQAFAALIARCERLVLSVAFAAVGDAELAGDLTQETFLRAWQKLGDLQDPHRFEAWLCGIVRHLAADHHRRLRPQIGVPAPEGETPPHRHPGAEIEDREQSQQIALALADLDEVSRSAVVLRYYEGLSSRQIGELLELTPAAVDMRLSRARQELRRRLSGSRDEFPSWAPEGRQLKEPASARRPQAANASEACDD